MRPIFGQLPMPNVTRASARLRRVYRDYLDAVQTDLPIGSKIRWRYQHGMQAGEVIGYGPDAAVRVKNDRTHTIQFIKFSRIVARIDDQQ